MNDDKTVFTHVHLPDIHNWDENKISWGYEE